MATISAVASAVGESAWLKEIDMLPGSFSGITSNASKRLYNLSSNKSKYTRSRSRSRVQVGSRFQISPIVYSENVGRCGNLISKFAFSEHFHSNLIILRRKRSYLWDREHLLAIWKEFII